MPMKYGATTNIVVVQYDPNDARRSRPELDLIDNGFGRFKVINHIEIPKSDMQYDMAVRTIIDLDKRYNPFAIYPDRGAGEFQLELLRKELGTKVKGVFYGETVDVRDPITRVTERKSLKPFLVNQTTLLLERGQLRIPNKEISEVIQRQMINYQVVKVSNKTQEPIYSDTDEHGLDAMIFALYAFIEEYPELINIIDKVEFETKMGQTKGSYYDAMESVESYTGNRFSRQSAVEHDEPTTRYRRVPLGFSKRKGANNVSSLGWGNEKKARNIWTKF